MVKLMTTQSETAVEARNQRVANVGEPTSAVAFGGVMDDWKPFEGYKHVRKAPKRETAHERRERERLEREAAENFNHDPLGLVKS